MNFVNHHSVGPWKWNGGLIIDKSAKCKHELKRKKKLLIMHIFGTKKMPACAHTTHFFFGKLSLSKFTLYRESQYDSFLNYDNNNFSTK